jgi:signal transduction histidine kinase
MSRLPAPGLRFKIVVSLALVLAGFTVVTEITVTQLARVALERQVEAARESGSEAVAAVVADKARAGLPGLRRLVLFYLVTGAVLVLVLGSVLIARQVVRPLGAVTRAVERVAEGDLGIRVPVEGAGELVRLAVSFNRMTQTLETQQREIGEQLAALERSARELREAQDGLIRAARLASVGTLAAGVAHEIGNPLAGVQGLLEALEHETDPAKAASFRELIRKELGRIDRIIGDLNAFARPRRVEGPSSCDLAQVVGQVRALLGAQQLFAGVEVAVEVPPGAALALAPDDATQVLVNLLLNAAQAMRGKGRVTVAARPVESWRPALAVVSRPAWEIAVTDTGPGVPPDAAERIFDPFFTRRGTGEGSGLGLAICQSICERAGAELRLDRAHAPGARFVLTVPRAYG